MIDPQHYANRELSWLAFNRRVLALAESERVPLLERAQFLAIFASNLDEYVQIRVAGLQDQVAAGVTDRTPDGRTASRQLDEVRSQVLDAMAQAAAVLSEQVLPALAEAGISISTWDDLDVDEQAQLSDEFERRIFPVLTPLAVDPARPFPYISNLSLSLAVTVRDPVTGELRFARVKVPPVLPRLLIISDGARVVPLEEVIGAHLDQLFPGVAVESWCAFRVTRNADLSIADAEADDLLAAVELELRRRRFSRAVRLEIESSAPVEVRALLQSELDVGDDDTYDLPAPIDLDGLRSLAALDRPDLRFPSKPRASLHAFDVDHADGDLWSELRAGEIMVHHPYGSFAESVEEFVRRAAADDQVLAIKITLYRISGDSPLVHSLMRAAEAGKQVVAMIELTARFDEETNIEWARRLEDAGVHVVYGVVGRKTHAKTTLVVRDEPDGVRRYCHVGTGNYNASTARTYEDLSLFTADHDLGADLTDLFNHLTGYGTVVEHRRLVVAPHHLRSTLRARIDAEVAAGPGRGRIRAKMNALVDPEMIEALYAASQAGVEIDLVVRGICCLRPGVPGLSERIRVRSLVGRFLEHSRIYEFANGDPAGGGTIYLGSADLMQRNLDRRVEALVPIRQPDLVDRLRLVLDECLADDALAWTLDADGAWTKVPVVEGRDAQARLRDHAVALADPKR